MEQFNLEEWLQDKSRKVVTRTGEPVEIINHEVMGKYCIYAKATWQDGEIFNICTTSNGEAYEGEETAYDLFFADEEEELTEFEKRIYTLINLYDPDNFSSIEEVKEEAEILLDLAREEIEKDNLIIDKDRYLKICDLYYNNGKKNALKELPKWKKATENKEFEINEACILDDDIYPIIATNVNIGEYYLELDELKNLPIEE